MGGDDDRADSSVNAMGAISALRTGNIKLDMAIAMIIPLIFRLIFEVFGDIRDRFRNGELRLDLLFFWAKPFIERVIEHKATQNQWGISFTDQDTRNNVLIKAIQLYLDHKKIPWQRSRVELMSITQSERRSWWCDDDEGDERSPAGKLKKYRLAQKAPNHRWENLGVFGGKKKLELSAPSAGAQSSSEVARVAEPSVPAMVELRVEEMEEDKGKEGAKTVNTLRYRFRSRSASAIDDFIEEAYQWYLGELRKMEDNSRYLYEMQVKGGTSSLTGEKEQSNSMRTYKRYKLSDHKTFESLFFEESHALLALLAHFKNKTGKYAIAGYPHKLGILLHGPPGTGKTSLIKAMAHHTGRSIVNVPLARITTNQELMDIMFDQQYLVEGEEVPIKLGFKDVIFVMEDVDAASKVVQRRDGKTTASVVRTERLEAPQPKSPWQILLECDDEGCRKVVKKLMGKSAKLKEAALSSGTLCNVVKQLVSPPGLSLLVGASTGDPSEDTKQRKEAKERLDATLQQHEAAQNYIKKFAASLGHLLEEETVEVDSQLVEELLGLRGASKLKPVFKTESKGYGTAEDTKHDHEDEDDSGGGGMDMSLALGMFASLMETSGSGSAGGSGGGGGGGGGLSSWGVSSEKKDKLNLSGLLNVLDGVVDTPDRILIMTTNHPEHLDPALIRPGRIDKKILLGFMSPLHAAHMIEHYFQVKLGPPQRERLRSSIMGNDLQGIPALNLTPAQIEQLAAEHDEVDSMLTALEHKATGVIVPSQPEAEARPTLAEAQGGPPATARPLPLQRARSVGVTFDT